jgi:hypothetical protein
MINDDERDHAEERANLADMRREAESEAAHERLVERVVAALRNLADEQQQQAQRGQSVIAEAIAGHSTIRPTSLLYVQRAAEVAHLAARAALTVDRYTGYHLDAQVEHLLLAHTRLAAESRVDAYEVAVYAAGQVRDAARAVLDADEQEQQDAREQADLDETYAYLRRVTR